MRWFVISGATSAGPVDTDELVEYGRTGRLVRGMFIRDEIGGGWMPVEDSPFGTFVAVAKKSRWTPNWSAIGAVACTLTLVVAGALIYLELRTHDALIARVDNATKHVDGVLLELRDANAPGAWVPVQQVHSNCMTDRTTVTCTFTNLGEKPVSTCTRGRLIQKGAPGVKLESLIMCTGKLLQGDSKVVTGPWFGGFADDICFKQNDYGKVLDWGKCEFDSTPVDLPTLRKVDAAVAAK